MTTNSGQAGIPPALARTVFGTRPDDAIAAVDVYTSQATTAINNTVDQVSSELTNAIASIGAGLNNPSLLAGLVNKTLGGPISQINAVQNLIGAIGGSKTALANLEKDSLDNLLAGVGFMGVPAAAIAEGLLGVPGGLRPQDILKTIAAPEIALVVDGVRVVRNTVNELKNLDAVGMVGVLNSIANSAGLAGYAEAFDLTAQLATVQNTLAWATYLRIPEIIDLVRDSLQADEDRARVLLAVAMQAAQASDMYTLQQCIDYNGYHTVLCKYPTIVNVFLTSYRFPEGATQAYHSDALALAGFLQVLNPNWNVYKRNGTSITNLEPYSSCGQAARASLMLLEDHYIPTMVAPQYPKTSLLTLARAMYPHTPINIQSGSVPLIIAA